MKTLKELLAKDHFAANAGVELLEVSPGYARARMLVTVKHLNAGGVCQGGALFTLADLAFAAVANSHLKLTLSLNANITFLRSAHEGYVYAEATETFSHARVPLSRYGLRTMKDSLLRFLPVPATGKTRNFR